MGCLRGRRAPPRGALRTAHTPPRPWGPALKVPVDRLRDWLLSHRYAMKCLDKKRIKMKQGETLALNERIMLSLVSTGVSGSPPHLSPWLRTKCSLR